ncbi:MAG TPA: hypothetical protein VF131_22995 [Blastocatellia bacterium]|nr:hypothetical protein [Blastocatellia bacterium]
MKYLLIVLLFYSFSHLVSAQPQMDLIGVVYSNTNQPLKDVEVTIVGVGRDVTTTSGQFRIPISKSRVGEQIRLSVAMRDWIVTNRSALTFTVPENPELRPIRIIMKKFAVNAARPVINQAIRNSVSESGNATNTNSAILNYIKAIAREADEVATVWERINDELVSRALENNQQEVYRTLYRYGLVRKPNAPNISRLTQFYELLQAEVIRNPQDRVKVNDVLKTTQNLIKYRWLTINQLDEMRNSATPNTPTNPLDLQKLSGIVELLRQEAAALQALAEAMGG